jgi:hypothetical protein
LYEETGTAKELPFAFFATFPGNAVFPRAVDEAGCHVEVAAPHHG